MSDCVCDASALALALVGDEETARETRTSLARGRRHAPHLIDAEIGSVLRGHERAGRLSAPQALAALRAAQAMIDQRYPHTGPLSDVAWRLRHNLTYYDALYVALATALDLPLLTADQRLSRSPDLPCAVELV